MILKHNDKGISYIELILVISIMILLTSFTTITMSVVNRNNVAKSADKVVTAMNHAKTLSLSKGTNKGSITFMSEKGKVYYYYGDNIEEKFLACSSPCAMTIKIGGADYKISGSTRVKLKISQATGAFVGAEKWNGATFVPVTPDFSGGTGPNRNRIIINNKYGKSANVDLNIHVGTVKASY